MSKKLRWFRLYAEIVDDEKLRLLAFEDRWHYVALLCLKCSGVLDARETDPEHIWLKKLTTKLGLSLRELKAMADRLEEVGLIDAATFQPLKWDERQFKSDGDNSAAERKRRQREREKEAATAPAAHATVTDASRVTERDSHNEGHADGHGHVTRPETETETETEIKQGGDARTHVHAREDFAPGHIAALETLTMFDRQTIEPYMQGLPASIDLQTWADFVKHRSAIRRPLSTSAWLQLRHLLRDFDAAGIDLNASLRQTMVLGLAVPVDPRSSGQGARAGPPRARTNDDFSQVTYGQGTALNDLPPHLRPDPT